MSRSVCSTKQSIFEKTVLYSTPFSLLFITTGNIKMGIVFGITGAPEPSYQLLKLPQKAIAKIDLISFEIRRYQPFVVAEVPLSDGEDNVGFSALARYL